MSVNTTLDYLLKPKENYIALEASLTFLNKKINQSKSNNKNGEKIGRNNFYCWRKKVKKEMNDLAVSNV